MASPKRLTKLNERYVCEYSLKNRRNEMKKNKWNKRNQMLLSIIIFFVFLIFMVIIGSFTFHRQRESISTAMMEALNSTNFSCLSGDKNKINITSATVVKVLEAQSVSASREEKISAVCDALLKAGLGLSKKEAIELAEWLTDFYMEKEVPSLPKEVLSSSVTEQIKQDLANITEYLSQLDKTVLQHREDILNLNTTQEEVYENLSNNLNNLQLSVDSMKQQFTAYENSYNNEQNAISEEFENIQIQVDNIQMEINNTQSEISELIHSTNDSSVEQYESIKSTIGKFESSINEILKSLNIDITKILKDLEKKNKQQNQELIIFLQEIQTKLDISLETLMQEVDVRVDQLVTNLENVHTDISKTQKEINSVLQDMMNTDTNRMDEIIGRFSIINNKLTEIHLAMNNTHDEIKAMLKSLRETGSENQQELLSLLSYMDSSFSEQNSQNLEQLIFTLQTQTEGIEEWFDELNYQFSQNFQSLTNTVTNIEENATGNKEELISNINQSFTDLSTSINFVNQVASDNKSEVLNRIADLENNTSANFSEVNQKLQEVFQSASDGKQLLASALLAKSISIHKDATFKEFYDAILSVKQQLVIGVEQIPGVINYDYHYHTGDGKNGGGCYTKKLYHQHSPECYSKATCTVTVHANGGFWSEGDDWCGCHGNVHRIKQNVIRKHSSCGAADNYGQISFTEHHGPGIDGFHGYDSSTHSYDKLSCGKTNATFVGWAVGCGFVDGQIIAAHIVYDPTAPVDHLSSTAEDDNDNIYVPQRYEDYVVIQNSGENSKADEEKADTGQEETSNEIGTEDKYIQEETKNEEIENVETEQMESEQIESNETEIKETEELSNVEIEEENDDIHPYSKL